jgi:hypothetical protein
MPDGTKTSFQKAAGRELIRACGTRRDRSRSARLPKNTRWRGSSSVSSRRRGAGLERGTLGSAIKTSGASFMHSRWREEKLFPIIASRHRHRRVPRSPSLISLAQQTQGVPHPCAFFAQEPALSGVEGVGSSPLAQWAQNTPTNPRRECLILARSLRKGGRRIDRTMNFHRLPGPSDSQLRVSMTCNILFLKWIHVASESKKERNKSLHI